MWASCGSIRSAACGTTEALDPFANQLELSDRDVLANLGLDCRGESPGGLTEATVVEGR